MMKARVQEEEKKGVSEEHDQNRAAPIDAAGQQALDIDRN